MFTKNFIEQHIHHFVPLPSAVFRQLHNSLFPKLLLSKQRTIPSMFYSLPGNLNFFPLREFYKDLNEWKAKTALSGKYS